jgi:hypothetical protein
LQCGLSGDQASQVGDNTGGCVSGNRLYGDMPVHSREILPDLSRKIYPVYCHHEVVAQYPSQKAGSEDGPKNPFKGTSMKFLVFACRAQRWADAGS